MRDNKQLATGAVSAGVDKWSQENNCAGRALQRTQIGKKREMDLEMV
jgi:hypothetical protein